MSACTNCGRDLTGAFCSGCGTAAPALDAEEPTTVPTPTASGASEAHVDGADEDTSAPIAPRPVVRPADALAPEPAGAHEGSEPRRSFTWVHAGVGILVLATIAAIVGFVVLPSDEAAAPTETSTTTTEATTTTEVTTTTEATTTTTTPPPSGPPERDVLDEPAGQLCRDLNTKGYSYAEAVTYWEHHGRPTQMDASGTGVPCQTVYPRSEVEARWGSAAPSVDLTSPLLWGYDDAVAFFNSNPEVRTNLADDLSRLTRSTSTVWTQEMLLALGSSACNDWEMLDDGTHTGRGEANWAAAIAPVLGVSESAALTAIQSNVWWNYQFVCA